MHIERLDHLVLTVADLVETCHFCVRVLGMELVTYGDARRALVFGSQKINIHERGKEFEPKAVMATPGSADLCFITKTPLDEVVEHLQQCKIPVVAGPVQRVGALGPIVSVYCRDPDGNLIEIANEHAG
jgi:catechol 2,3-dioxygenase-like lactoylglutathione lyase family enzyme